MSNAPLDAMNMNYKEAKEALTLAIRARLTPYLAGSPGIGKSALVAEIAKEFNLKLIDLRLSQLDPTDLNGFPFIDEVTKIAGYRPMETFPLEDAELPFTGRTEADPAGNMVPVMVNGQPERYAGWLLFLDEFPSASLAVQKAAYKLVLDHMVGQHKLHPKVAKICAGNLETDNAIVAKLSTAMQSRLIHLQITSDATEWLHWANGAGIDYRITSFISFKRDALNMFQELNAKKAIQNTFPCERTWEFASRMISKFPDLLPIHTKMLAGCIGSGMAMEFVGFTKVFHDLPSIADIIANPNSAKMPVTPDCKYAVTGLLAQNMTDATAGPILQYAKRLDTEFTVITMQSALRRNENLIINKHVQEWITQNATDIA